jgi:hypothetical protein
MVAKVPKTGPSVTASSIVTKMECEGFECSVRIDKKSLQIYQAQRVGDVNSGYIESQSVNYSISLSKIRGLSGPISVSTSSLTEQGLSKPEVVQALTALSDLRITPKTLHLIPSQGEAPEIQLQRREDWTGG